MYRCPLALTVVAFATPALAETPDFLVIKDDAGKYKPGAAASWKASDAGVTFVLGAGLDAEQTATTLRDSLAAAKVTVAGNSVVVSGIPVDVLLDQLSLLSLSGEGGDPLAELAGLGGTAAMDAPEGGGSIRASKPTATMRPRIIKDHDPNERVSAEVVKVVRGAFPQVTLTLKVRSTAKAGPLKKKVRRGKVVSGRVALAADGGGVVFAEAATQRNLAAYYLSKGDRITVHAVEVDGAIELDFVERKTK